MINKCLREIRRDFNTVIEAFQRLEQLGACGSGYAPDVALVLLPLNERLRVLMGELDPFADMQAEHVRKNRDGTIPPTEHKGISCIRRSVELGLEAMEGIHGLASIIGAETDAPAKHASWAMVAAIFQLERAMNDLDSFIDREGERYGPNLVSV